MLISVPNTIHVKCFKCFEVGESGIINMVPYEDSGIFKYQDQLKYRGNCDNCHSKIDRTVTPSGLQSYPWALERGLFKMEESKEIFQWKEEFGKRWRKADMKEPKDWLFYTRTTSNTDLTRELVCLETSSMPLSVEMRALKEAILTELASESFEYGGKEE